MQSQSDVIELPTHKLSPTLIDAFAHIQPRPSIRTASRGRSIVREGVFADHSMLLLEGWVSLSKTLPCGATQIIDVMLPGDFALIGASHIPVAACSVEALSTARFMNIPPTQANSREPAVARLQGLITAEIVRTQARTAELLLRMGRGNAASRVAYVLLEFFVRLEAIGMVKNDRFTFPMTQHRIGEFTGLSNVHVCRTMRLFERDGILSYPDTADIVLNKIDVLCDIAGIDLVNFRNKILMRYPRDT